MKNIKKLFFTFVLLTLCLINSSIPAFAASSNTITEGEVYTVQVNDEISYEYSVIPDISRAASRTSATAKGRFYLTSDGTTVANTTLKVYFEYDGSTVEAYDSTASAEAVESGWSISFNDTRYDSNAYNASGSAMFTLYHDGEFNNSLTAIVYCTKNGDTSTVIN